jgi:hypothetical protein
MICKMGHSEKKITKLPLMLKTTDMPVAVIVSWLPQLLDMGQSLQQNLLLWAKSERQAQ